MASYKGKEGYWFTTKTGSHIFVENGQDPKQAIEEAFDITDEESGFEQAKYDIIAGGYHNKNFKKRQLSHLFSPDELDRDQMGSDIYDDFATGKAKEFLNKMPKVPKGNIEESTRKANLALPNFMEKYTTTGADGTIYWKDSKNVKKRNHIFNTLNNNCQRCVMAWYLQYLGYDVMAKPRNPDGDWILRQQAPTSQEGWSRGATWELSGFIVPDKYEYDYTGKEGATAEDQYNGIKETANKYPDGSVFFCSIDRAKSGHVFIVLKDKGEVKFIEPQTNNYHNESEFKNVIPEHTRLVRVNDLKLDGTVLPEVVQEVSKGGYRG